MSKKKLGQLQIIVTEILLITQLVFLFVLFVIGAIVIWKVA